MTQHTLNWLGLRIGQHMLKDVRLPVQCSVDAGLPIGYVKNQQDVVCAAPVVTVYLTPALTDQAQVDRLTSKARLIWPLLGGVFGCVCVWVLNAAFNHDVTAIGMSARQLAPCLIHKINDQGVQCLVQGQAQLVRQNELFPDGVSRLLSVNSDQSNFLYQQAHQMYLLHVKSSAQ